MTELKRTWTILTERRQADGTFSGEELDAQVDPDGMIPKGFVDFVYRASRDISPGSLRITINMGDGTPMRIPVLEFVVSGTSVRVVHLGERYLVWVDRAPVGSGRANVNSFISPDARTAADRLVRSVGERNGAGHSYVSSRPYVEADPHTPGLVDFTCALMVRSRATRPHGTTTSGFGSHYYRLNDGKVEALAPTGDMHNTRVLLNSIQFFTSPVSSVGELARVVSNPGTDRATTTLYRGCQLLSQRKGESSAGEWEGVLEKPAILAGPDGKTDPRSTIQACLGVKAVPDDFRGVVVMGESADGVPVLSIDGLRPYYAPDKDGHLLGPVALGHSFKEDRKTLFEYMSRDIPPGYDFFLDLEGGAYFQVRFGPRSSLVVFANQSGPVSRLVVKGPSNGGFFSEELEGVLRLSVREVKFGEAVSWGESATLLAHLHDRGLLNSPGVVVDRSKSSESVLIRATAIEGEGPMWHRLHSDGRCDGFSSKPEPTKTLSPFAQAVSDTVGEVMGDQCSQVSKIPKAPKLEEVLPLPSTGNPWSVVVDHVPMLVIPSRKSFIFRDGGGSPAWTVPHNSGETHSGTLARLARSLEGIFPVLGEEGKMPPSISSSNPWVNELMRFGAYFGRGIYKSGDEEVCIFRKGFDGFEAHLPSSVGLYRLVAEIDKDGDITGFRVGVKPPLEAKAVDPFSFSLEVHGKDLGMMSVHLSDGDVIGFRHVEGGRVIIHSSKLERCMSLAVGHTDFAGKDGYGKLAVLAVERMCSHIFDVDETLSVVGISDAVGDISFAAFVISQIFEVPSIFFCAGEGKPDACLLRDAGGFFLVSETAALPGTSETPDVVMADTGTDLESLPLHHYFAAPVYHPTLERVWENLSQWGMGDDPPVPRVIGGTKTSEWHEVRDELEAMRAKLGRREPEAPSTDVRDEVVDTIAANQLSRLLVDSLGAVLPSAQGLNTEAWRALVLLAFGASPAPVQESIKRAMRVQGLAILGSAFFDVVREGMVDLYRKRRAAEIPHPPCELEEDRVTSSYFAPDPALVPEEG